MVVMMVVMTKYVTQKAAVVMVVIIMVMSMATMMVIIHNRYPLHKKQLARGSESIEENLLWRGHILWYRRGNVDGRRRRCRVGSGLLGVCCGRGRTV